MFDDARDSSVFFAWHIKGECFDPVPSIEWVEAHPDIYENNTVEIFCYMPEKTFSFDVHFGQVSFKHLGGLKKLIGKATKVVDF